MAAARHLGDQFAGARLSQSLARAHGESGDYRRAIESYRTAQVAFDELGDVRGRANALNGIAGVQLLAGHPAEALVAGGEALGLYLSIGDDAATAGTYSIIGRASHAVDKLIDARRYYQIADDLYARIENLYGLAHSADCMADLAMTTGDHEHAIEQLCRAIELHHQMGNVAYAARSCRKLRFLLLQQGTPDAHTKWRNKAIAILEANDETEDSVFLDS